MGRRKKPAGRFVSPRFAALLRMLASEPRRAILIELAGEPKDRQTLSKATGLSGSSVSHHLTQLLKHRLVRVERRGRRLSYRIGPQATVIVGRERAIVSVSTRDGYEATIAVLRRGSRAQRSARGHEHGPMKTHSQIMFACLSRHALTNP